MRKLITMLCCCLAISTACAQEDSKPRLNKVTLPLQAEQWLTTTSALVDVMINASVADQGLESVRANVMQKLQQLSSKNQWHILSFDRQQDQSGLESVQIKAQARLDQADLNGLRDKAKTISKPGETYTIADIAFTPSDEEIRAANTALRKNIYEQAKAEMDTLNVLYPDQKYYLHQINFIPQMMPMQKSMVRMADTAAMAAPSLPVGNKAELSAVVELASGIN